MQCPKISKNEKPLKHHTCKEPGCGREFFGHAIAKYCNVHHDPRNRVHKKKPYEKACVKNQIFKHKIMETTVLEFPCSLEGCANTFRVKVYPRQFVYPKYCEAHRSEYRRNLFSRRVQNA